MGWVHHSGNEVPQFSYPRQTINRAHSDKLCEVPMSRQSFLRLLFVLTVPFLIVRAVSAQVYTITDLGALSPTAVNSFGQIVGNNSGQAFTWTRFGGMKGLGLLPGGTASYAASINDLGVVTGYADGAGIVISPDSSIPNQTCTDLTQPFLWEPGKGMSGLGTVGVPPYEILFADWCGIQFYATGVNNLGQIVGYTVPYSDEYQWAFFWTKSEGWTAASPLFGSSFPPTMGNGIRDTGEVVGQTGELIGGATEWKDGVESDLSGLGSGDSSSANAVNELGQAAGWSTTLPLDSGCQQNLVNCPMHAVMWTRAGVISDLGTLPGDTLSAATGINFFGQIIGDSGNTLEENGWGGNGGSGFNGEGGSVEVVGRPFIWREPGGMQDLNTLIRSGSGWVLNSATGINFWGQIIGTGTLNGESHGFLLTP
jgi:uncharacterized membrane protein